MNTKCLIILSLISCFTQIALSQKTKLLIKAGSNYFTVSGDKIDNRDTTEYSIEAGGIGYQFGYSFEYLLSQKSSLMAGAEFSHRRYDEKLASEKLDPEFFYMSFPLLFNYRVHKNIKISLGGRIDYLLRKRPFRYQSLDLGPGFLNYDFGLLSGVRYRIWNFEFELMTSYGLVNIIFDKTSTPFNHALNNAKSRILSFSCSYVLD